jgi:hypothetical protein
MTTTETVRSVIAALDRSGPADVGTIVQPLRDLGIQPGVHVGRTDMKPGSLEALEWYAGQILEVVDREAWFAMNSLINCCDKFAPEGGP